LSQQATRRSCAKAPI